VLLALFGVKVKGEVTEAGWQSGFDEIFDQGEREARNDWNWAQ
jgi:hypothetical protein